ncbi:MAG: hypothetical protein AAGB48_09475 [Planctomycetota bacterium]
MPKQTKIFVAIVLAVAGLSLAIRGLLPTRSERTDTPKPRLVAADGSVPEPVQRERAPANLREIDWIEDEDASYELTRVRSDADARSQAQAIGTRVDASSAGAGASLATLLSALTTKDGDLDAALSELGGAEGQGPGAFDAIIGPLLRHASADPTAIRISTPEQPPEAVRGISVNRSVNRDGDSDPLDITTLSATFESRFPGILDQGARGELIEVKIPMRSKGSDADGPDSWLTLVLRRTGAGWQPASASLATTDKSVMDHVRRTIADLRQSGSENEPRGG